MNSNFKLSWRFKKQLIYGSFILFIFLLIFLSIFFLIKKPTKPSCFDGKKNQGEIDIDCGGPCPPCSLKTALPFKIFNQQFIVHENSIDLLALLENPNKNLFLKKLNYYFEIYGYDNNYTTTTIKETALYPSSKKYIVEFYPKPNFLIKEIKLKILEPNPFDFQEKQKEKLDISYYNQQLIKDILKWKIKVTLFNQSFKDEDVEVIVFVYNKDKKLIAVGKTFVYLKGNEVKDINIFLNNLNEEISSDNYGIEIYIQK